MVVGSISHTKMARKQETEIAEETAGIVESIQDSGANSKPPENDLTKAPVEPAPVLIDKKELREAAWREQKLVLSTSEYWLFLEEKRTRTTMN